MLLLLLGWRRALRGRWCLGTEELSRVRMGMLKMVGRWCLMMLEMVRRGWCERCHEMLLAADDVDAGFKQHDAATAGAHG